MDIFMKKLSKLAILAVLSTIGTAAAAEDGTITFEGTISDATCTITGGDAQGESESPDFTVHLPSIREGANKSPNAKKRLCK
ncbi:TPA: fimbrial protein [Enterobacter kobei]|uniref:fimbrial protein n=1 Tax=Enterobacter kobei TaxID=208224 RepID=UPI001D024D8C|nr:hypothetical protein [Enterobacter kobei]MCR2777106.1 hypothetical protein [Enterobacter kobei]MCR2798203.1 hypothetical protein [Enterobacter kobei]